MPEDRRGTPTTVQELWYLIEADQKATREWRHDMRDHLQGMNAKFNSFNSELGKIDAKLNNDYIRKEYFEAVIFPIRNIVFGMVGLILSTVILALLYLVLSK